MFRPPKLLAPPGDQAGASPAPVTRSPFGAVAIGTAVTLVCVLPVFLTGAMAVQLTNELAFGAAGLGMAVGVFRATSAATAVYLGRVADRLGAIWSMRLAAIVAAVASIGIATTATSWATLVAWLMVGSCANALGQPAANRLLVNNVPHRRQGTAFGFKQSGPPTASMLAGLSVPLIALTWGWRWAYVLTAVFAVLVVLAVGRRPPPAARRSRADRGQTRLRDPYLIITLAGAFALGTAASSVVSVFYVDAAVRAGTAEELAGAILAVSSAAAILMRLIFGMIADRIAAGHLRLCAGMLIAGTVGLVLLATGHPAMMALGAFVALAGTWGFNGVFVYAVVRTHPESPGTVTGALMPGALIGGTVGPILFGIVAVSVAYGAAWALAGLVAVLAAGAMLVGAGRLRVAANLAS